MVWGVSQAVGQLPSNQGPEFKPQYSQKKEKELELLQDLGFTQSLTTMRDPFQSNFTQGLTADSLLNIISQAAGPSTSPPEFFPPLSSPHSALALFQY
jgi:hypothetical protein